MTPFNPSAYAPVLGELLRDPWVPPLGAGAPNHEVRAQLEALSSNHVFAPGRVRDGGMADACRAGLWLYHNFLEQSHQISQDLPTPTGSYWHALMHRQEPDFSNAKYWFRRVGAHPVYETLCRDAAELAVEAPPAAAFLRTQATWDPFAFVDLCAAVLVGRAPGEELCRQIQKREWELLFDWCYRQAIEES